jgi:hypothetical protein
MAVALQNRVSTFKGWYKYSAASKATCIPQESIGGTPSYVSLMTCLEMGQWAR